MTVSTLYFLDIGDWFGGDNTRARAVNSSVQIVGDQVEGANTVFAGVFTGGEIVEIPVPVVTGYDLRYLVPYAISENGIVAGEAGIHCDVDGYDAFVYNTFLFDTSTETTNFPTHAYDPAGYDYSTSLYGYCAAYDINADDDAAGYLSKWIVMDEYNRHNGDSGAIFPSGGGTTDIGPSYSLSGGFCGVATGINSDGTICGAYALGTATPTTYCEAAIYDGSWSLLGTLAGDEMSAAQDINDSEQIVGTSYSSKGSWINVEAPGASKAPSMFSEDFGSARAFLYDSVGGMVEIIPPGATHSYGLAINNRGDMIGVAYTGSGSFGSGTDRFGFVRYADGTYLAIPTFGGSYSIPLGISDAGIIVGYSMLEGDTTYRAFVTFIAADAPNGGGFYFLPTNDTENPFVLTGNDARIAKIVPLWPNPYQANSSNDDVLYVVAKRTIGGNAVRYIERLHNRYIGS